MRGHGNGLGKFNMAFDLGCDAIEERAHLEFVTRLSRLALGRRLNPNEQICVRSTQSPSIQFTRSVYTYLPDWSLVKWRSPQNSLQIGGTFDHKTQSYYWDPMHAVVFMDRGQSVCAARRAWLSQLRLHTAMQTPAVLQDETGKVCEIAGIAAPQESSFDTQAIWDDLAHWQTTTLLRSSTYRERTPINLTDANCTPLFQEASRVA